jgi:RHS repeat-associated protein
VPEYTNRFVYDGWNLSAILNPNASIAASFMWGTDLSGSMQGAGGVGGLLAENLAGNGVQFAAYDANGNVAALVSASSGTVTANYEYGPFGEVIRATGPMAKANPFRFSTKYQDDESDLLYYGFRYLNTSSGRWLNRDQRDERKWEKNVYSFAENRPINSYDLLGLYSVASCQANVDKIMNNPGASSRELRKVLAAIKAIPGCTPLKPTCMCCTGNDNKNWVGYVDGGNLNICANNIKDTSLLLETLVHENIHVLQKCRKQDLNSCDGAVCSEIQAALNDGTCQRTSPNDVRSCVINEAATSSENRCGSRENARQRAEALYDQCNQSEP